MVSLYNFNLHEDVKRIWENDDGSLLPAKVLGALLLLLLCKHHDC